MELKLYGFKLCPFVERINIVLNEHNIDCERIQVDIRNKPDWFLKISPMGKVPILEADGVVIFESSVISDFLDSLKVDKSLYPKDPIRKALNRSWIEWGSGLIFDAYHMTLAKSQSEFNEKQEMVISKLEIFEDQMNCSPFFNGEMFSMIDIVYAPLMKRFEVLRNSFDIDLLAEYGKLKAWSQQILARNSVQNSFSETFEENFHELLKLKGSHLV